MKAHRDEPLEEIWAIRRQIAQKLNCNPQLQVAHYQRKQKQLGARFYSRSRGSDNSVTQALVLRDKKI